MPDSGAVYQPTTVGYIYDIYGGEGISRGGSSFRSGFWRIISRHKISSRKWLELLLSSAAMCFFVGGFTMILVSLVYVPEEPELGKEVNGQSTTNVERPEDSASNSIACGASMMLLGLLSACGWAWLRFFRRGKSPRGGMVGSSGQMLGGLNPSTDLLVGSTSQYGPVLTELPSSQQQQQQLKPMNAAGDHQHNQQEDATRHVALPLSDHEEETRTLMHEATTPSHAANAIADQLPG